jgi:serine/threonine protein kinase
MGLPLPVVQRMARQLLGALDHLHASGVVHMAVKPENILLDKPFVSVHEVGPPVCLQVTSPST